MNKFLITIVALVSGFTATAQVLVEEKTVDEVTQQEEVNTPYHKGNFTVSLVKGWGYYGYTNRNTEQGGKPSYSLVSQYQDWADESIYNKTFVGIEGGWFFLNDWKATLEFGLSHTYNPGHLDVPAVGDIKNGGAPKYEAVASKSSTTYRFVGGVNRYFTFPSTPKLSFYGGAKIGYAHGVKAYKVDTVESKGVSSAESLTFSIGLVSGIDYFFIPEMYAGLQINPISYSYNLTNIKPEPGLGSLGANAHNFSLIGAPTIKIGFIF